MAKEPVEAHEGDEPTVDPTVAADIKSDEAGEPRSKDPALPPPGTEVPTFWQAQATKGALAATIGLALFAAYAYIDWLYTGVLPSPDAIKLSLGIFTWAWGSAWGIHATDSSNLRWK